eukprot:1145683-Pelagomonas_calceolata.AAC.1
MHAQHAAVGNTELQQEETLQELGFLKVDPSWRDRAGRQILLVSARKFSASKVVDLEKLYT